MSNLITNKMRYYSSENFLQSITSADDYLYMFLAKSSKWPEGFGYEDPLVDSDVLDREVWKDILAMKRILPSDCFRVINAFSWVSGTLYDEYDDSKELDQLTFYVINNNNVYKCISNDRGKVSTIAPTGVESGLLETTDRYIWKFMYGIPAGDDGNWSQWSITGWFPVSNIKTESENPEQWNVMDNASKIDGAIYNFRYDDELEPDNLAVGQSVTIEGDGTGFAGIVKKDAGPDEDKFRIEVTESGLGYTYWSKVLINNVWRTWAEPILSPPGGHGSNTVTELDGFYIIVGSVFESGGFFIGNEYRRIGIVSNPLRKKDSRGNENTRDKIVGDELMVVYGSPIEIENAENKAVKTAIEMQNRLKELNKSLPHPIDIGIGINSGKVISGNIGSEIRSDFTVIGDNVNLAARLCSFAKAKEIIISENTKINLSSSQDLEGLPPFSVKGKKQKISAFKVQF